MLGRHVGGAAAGAVEARHRGHVDDAAPPARQHLGDGALAAEEDTGEVDVDDPPPHRLAHLVHVEVAVEDPGIVDHDVQRAQLLHRHR